MVFTPNRAGIGATSDVDLALLFTDVRGRVVFVDRGFFQLMPHLQDSQVVGQSLHKCLGCSQGDIRHLLTRIAQEGYVHDCTLSLQLQDGPLAVRCVGVATCDEKGNFIGADLTLQLLEEGGAEENLLPVPQWDVVSHHISRIRVQAQQRHTEEEQVFLELYFGAHVDALIVLLARLGGPRVRAALVRSFNTEAYENGWPVAIRDDGLEIGNGILPLHYVRLLDDVVGYATNVIGRRLIQREMNRVRERLDPRCLEFVAHAGLDQAGTD